MMKSVALWLRFALLGFIGLCSSHCLIRVSAAEVNNIRLLSNETYHPARYPHWCIADNQLFLFWQRSSPGLKSQQTLKVVSVLPNGEHVDTGDTIDYREPGYEPSALHYACLAKNGLETKLPLAKVEGSIQMPDPAQRYSQYSVIGLADGNLLYCYESNLRYKLGNLADALRLKYCSMKNSKIEMVEENILPTPTLLPFTQYSIREVMRRDHLTYDQVMNKLGKAAKKELDDDYSNPSLAYDPNTQVVFGVGTSSSVDIANKNNVWRILSRDNGKTWKPQQLLGVEGYYPDILCDGEDWYLLLTERGEIPEGLSSNVVLGYWPDEIKPKIAWPYTGKLVLYHINKDGGIVDGSKTIVVNDPYCIQASMAKRKDGIYIITYIKTNANCQSTSLWITTSRDCIRWEKPTEIVNTTTVLRDADTIVFNGDLWITYMAKDTDGKEQVVVRKHPLK